MSFCGLCDSSLNFFYFLPTFYFFEFSTGLAPFFSPPPWKYRCFVSLIHASCSYITIPERGHSLFLSPFLVFSDLWVNLNFLFMAKENHHAR